MLESVAFDVCASLAKFWTQQGNLRGYDQTTNLILENCHERIFAPDEGVEEVPLGLYIIRGDNVAVIGELDEAMSQALDLSAIRAQPLKPLVH
eukprot:scaffold470_cov257-Pinguiococcus_pyrenoidosus.AAC.16